MQVLTLNFRTGVAWELRRLLREVAFCPTPAIAGLRARHWRAEKRTVRGRYLFEERTALESFTRNPALDPAFELLASWLAVAPVAEQVEETGSLHVFDRPVFIISAPRAGSTLLYELLSNSDEWWTIDAESEGVIEGIPSLHLANRDFDSHQLTALNANAETVETLLAGFIAEIRDGRGKRFLELTAGERPAQVRLLEKTPENSLRVSFLAAAFPSARFIFLHRDARQNVSSILEAWSHHGFINIPGLPGWPLGRWHFLLPEGWREFCRAPLLDVAAFQWNAANQRALDDLEAIDRDRWISVDYSELVASPAVVVRRIGNFAGIGIDERLAAALARPLAVSTTAISPPSPIKWRSNREFRESALARYAPTTTRLRNLGR